MKQMNNPSHTPPRDRQSVGKSTRDLSQAPLHSGVLHVSPLLALILGIGGVFAGSVSNCYQVWTTMNAFLIMLLTSTFYVNMLKKDPAHAAGFIPTFNSASWVLAIFIQIGVLFFTLRVAHEFKEQLASMQGSTGGRGRVKQASKATAVQISHNRDFLFYYGIACFLANCLGDYGYVYSFTDNIEFLFFWGIVLTATSTLILALGGEFLWASYSAWRHARSEWDATYAASARNRQPHATTREES